MAGKMGRPLSDNPRNNVVGCKLTNEELLLLEKHCNKNNKTKSEVLIEGIKPIINPRLESE